MECDLLKRPVQACQGTHSEKFWNFLTAQFSKHSTLPSWKMQAGISSICLFRDEDNSHLWCEKSSFSHCTLICTLIQQTTNHLILKLVLALLHAVRRPSLTILRPKKALNNPSNHRAQCYDSFNKLLSAVSAYGLPPMGKECYANKIAPSKILEQYWIEWIEEIKDLK